ncbi:MAG: hypothetical protein JWQ24_1533 [Tardiphaga sp.]|nr:hypothetical protein [Tardiphaga sp.]
MKINADNNAVSYASALRQSRTSNWWMRKRRYYKGMTA